MIGETIERTGDGRTSAGGLAAADIAALDAWLADLELVDPGLPSAARRYVLDGGGDAPRRLASPARRPSWNDLYPLQEEKTRAAHRLFFAPVGWDAPAIRRFSAVVAAYLAITGQTAQTPGTRASPESFRALLGFGERCLGGCSPGREGARWLLDGARCLELLALDDADQAALTDALFATPEQNAWGGAVPRALLAMPGLAEALAAAPTRTLAGARSLDARAALRFIVFLGRGGVAGRPEFLDFLFESILEGGRRQTRAALTAFAACPEAQVRDRAAALLRSGQTEERVAAVTVLARLASPAARAMIERHATGETARKVRQTIEENLAPIRLAGRPGDGRTDGPRGYTAIDGGWIAIPPAEPPPPDTPPPATLAADLAAAVDEANREAERLFRESGARHDAALPDERKRHFVPERFEPPYPAGAIGEFLAVMAGRLDPRRATEPARALAAPPRHRSASAAALYEARLETLLGDPAVTLHHLARLTALEAGPPTLWATRLTQATEGGPPAQRLLSKRADAARDLRPTLAVCAAVGGDARAFLTGVLQQDWGRMFVDVYLPDPGRLWPLVAENLDLLDQAFGLAPAPPAASFNVIRALELVATLPAPPRRHLSVLVEHGIDGQRDHKALARAILRPQRGVGALIAPMLASDARSRRIGAAEWLRERRERAMIPALRAALGRQRSDAGRAALLGALSALGDDIADQFSETRQLAEARAGLTKTKSAVALCAPLDGLPALAWRNGRKVPSEIARWWVVLADKLKSPRGDPLLNLALDRLDRDSAERLAIFVLSSFIAYDILRPTEAEANAYAEAEADGFWRSRGRWEPDLSREQAFAALKRSRLGVYLRSALAHRGILALARRAPAGAAVAMVKAYFRDHHGRAPQCRALLDALSNNVAPAALQFVLGIAARWRTAGVRRHAADLARRIADERGWTREEFADRIAPTGGLDEAGVLPLAIGDRTYSATLGATLDVTLRNPDGRIVRGLPPGDDAATARARAALSDLRREVRQSLKHQGARLHDAMCAGRVWPPGEIAACLLRHPIVGRLCQRLVFAGFDADGRLAGTLRPLGDGSLTGARDETIALDAFARVGIAHRALLDEAQAQAWRDHLSDYAIAPLFDQLSRPFLSPEAGRRDDTAILDREGWMLDTLTLRRAAEMLGYQRGEPVDGARFTTYEKPFPAAERVAVIEFTGSAPPEGAAPCALLGLSVMRAGARSDRRRALRLGAAPPILLSETWNDLHAIAAAGAGFDPDWRARTGGSRR